jgi:hypothetical protein
LLLFALVHEVVHQVGRHDDLLAHHVAKGTNIVRWGRENSSTILVAQSRGVTHLPR